jgi:murein tripeptide amidase MpaA
MIPMAGSAERSFLFPAELPAAFAFLGDVKRSFAFLPYISIAESYSQDQFRLHYRALEAGFYQVDIFCDVQVIRAENPCLLIIRSLPGKAPVKSAARWNNMICQGTYESQSNFYQVGANTRIDFSIQLAASLPVPAALRLVPPALVSSATHNILQQRIDEVSSGFIEQSIRAYTG